MSRRTKYSIAYIFLMGVQIALGLYFENLTAGLFGTNTSGGAFNCRELLSSGSDDDVLLALFVVLVLPVIFRLVLWKKRPLPVEKGVLAATYLLLGVALIVGPDCGQVFYTAFVVGNAVLITLFFCAICSVFLLFRSI